jgi:hypothetical protein
MALSGDKDYSAKAIRKELKSKGLAAIERVTIKNPVTGKKSVAIIERDGTPESKLVLALVDKTKSQEQKDGVISAYLFERGKESASFLLDLYQSKGKHTKETRVFKSQMRFDFELFADLIVRMLHEASLAIARDVGPKGAEQTLLELGNQFSHTADTIADRMQKITEERMRDKGFGIYIGLDRKPYSIFDDNFDEVIAKERTRVEQLKDEKHE